MDNAYTSWMKDEHVQLFDHKKYYPRFFLKQNFENFNEIYLLRRMQDRNSSFSLLEVGCATGEFYRYFKYIYPRIDYDGFDISQKAIETAKIKFPMGRFYTNSINDFSKMKQIYPEWVFCRDVVLHQVQPFEFIRNLCDIAQKYVLLRMRTRDVGKTVLDPNLSCQLNYGAWAPYMILNCEELILDLKTHCPDVHEIIFMKHYMVLGGYERRFLPKECYDPKTKTAETAVLIKKGHRTSQDIVVSSWPSKEKNKRHIMGGISARLVRSLVVPLNIKRVWW